MQSHEFFVSLFVGDDLIHELFVDVEHTFYFGAQQKAVEEAVKRTIGDELVTYTMAVVQNINEKSMIPQFRYSAMSGKWTFSHLIFIREYMELVS